MSTPSRYRRPYQGNHSSHQTAMASSTHNSSPVEPIKAPRTYPPLTSNPLSENNPSDSFAISFDDRYHEMPNIRLKPKPTHEGQHSSTGPFGPNPVRNTAKVVAAHGNMQGPAITAKPPAQGVYPQYKGEYAKSAGHIMPQGPYGAPIEQSRNLNQKNCSYRSSDSNSMHNTPSYGYHVAVPSSHSAPDLYNSRNQTTRNHKTAIASHPTNSPMQNPPSPPDCSGITSNPNSIHQLLKATADRLPQAYQQSSYKPIAPVKLEQVTKKSSRYNMRPKTLEFMVTIELPTRTVEKKIDNNCTCSNIVQRLIREHRLEFNSEELILWECLNGIQRPVRVTEKLIDIISGVPGVFFKVTSDELKHDEHSLASLVPRRDMMRKIPEIPTTEIQFSVPGNSNLIKANETGDISGLLTWGAGYLQLSDAKLSVFQKGEDRLVCESHIELLDVYELTKGKGPLKYTVAVRNKLSGADIKPVMISTGSAKVLNVLRNSIYTARTRFLLLHK